MFWAGNCRHQTGLNGKGTDEDILKKSSHWLPLATNLISESWDTEIKANKDDIAGGRTSNWNMVAWGCLGIKLGGQRFLLLRVGWIYTPTATFPREGKGLYA